MVARSFGHPGLAVSSSLARLKNRVGQLGTVVHVVDYSLSVVWALFGGVVVHFLKYMDVGPNLNTNTRLDCASSLSFVGICLPRSGAIA